MGGTGQARNAVRGKKMAAELCEAAADREREKERERPGGKNS